MARSSNHIAVLDYGMGNLHSVSKALQKVSEGARISVSADKQVLDSADRIVFPGVGAIRDCMAEIKRRSLDVAIEKAIRTKPVLAICVGMQALMDHSEENGGVDCLRLLPGNVRLFRAEQSVGYSLKVPHMGWNCVHQSRSHRLWDGIEQHSRFYFVHSYFVETSDTSLISGQCHYGNHFVAAIGKENLFAVQFHPEKSASSGLRLLKNFVAWDI